MVRELRQLEYGSGSYKKADAIRTAEAVGKLRQLEVSSGIVQIAEAVRGQLRQWEES